MLMVLKVFENLTASALPITINALNQQPQTYRGGCCTANGIALHKHCRNSLLYEQLTLLQ